MIDLNEQIRVDAYEVPDRLVEHVAAQGRSLRLPLVHPTSPWLRHRPRHPVPTRRTNSSDNLAALCRHHHRLKTHSTWTYTVIEPGTYLWSAPTARQYLVDPTGTAET